MHALTFHLASAASTSCNGVTCTIIVTLLRAWRAS